MADRTPLPCPFCGETPRLSRGERITGHVGDHIYAYDCPTPRCPASHWNDHGISFHPSESDARETWNRRAS